MFAAPWPGNIGNKNMLWAFSILTRPQEESRLIDMLARVADFISLCMPFEADRFTRALVFEWPPSRLNHPLGQVDASLDSVSIFIKQLVRMGSVK